MAAATARHMGGSRHYSETVLKNIGENFVAPANSVSIITSYPVQLYQYDIYRFGGNPLGTENDKESFLFLYQNLD